MVNVNKKPVRCHAKYSERCFRCRFRKRVEDPNDSFSEKDFEIEMGYRF